MENTKMIGNVKYYNAEYVNIVTNNMYDRDGKTYIRWRLFNDRARSVGYMGEKMNKDSYISEFDLLKVLTRSWKHGLELFETITKDLEERLEGVQ